MLKIQAMLDCGFLTVMITALTLDLAEGSMQCEEGASGYTCVKRADGAQRPHSPPAYLYLFTRVFNALLLHAPLVPVQFFNWPRNGPLSACLSSSLSRSRSFLFAQRVLCSSLASPALRSTFPPSHPTALFIFVSQTSLLFHACSQLC